MNFEGQTKDYYSHQVKREGKTR